MCSQIFFVTSLRGSGSVPTILARCSEGCIGFIKALFFALGVVFAIFALHPCRKRASNSAITGIVTDQVARCAEKRKRQRKHTVDGLSPQPASNAVVV